MRRTGSGALIATLAVLALGACAGEPSPREVAAQALEEAGVPDPWDENVDGVIELADLACKGNSAEVDRLNRALRPESGYALQHAVRLTVRAICPDRESLLNP